MATPAIVKRILRTDVFQTAISVPLAIYFQIVTWTARMDRAEPPIAEPYLLATWHGRLIMLPMLRTRKKALYALISGHRDGRIISKVGAHFGIETVTGSSSRGGMRAVRELIRLARDGHSLYVTPDGPRGPRMRVNHEGIVDLARLTGLPILPATVAPRRAVIFESWDRLLLPLPFSRIVIRFGEPLHLDAGETKQDAMARIGAALTQVQDDGDRLAGRDCIAPG